MSSSLFVLPVEMRGEIVAHARAEAPRECCGVISGRDGVPATLYRLTNLEPGVDRYLIDDEEHFAVYRAFDARGEEQIAIYHSHPVSVAYPSKTDVEHAYWPDSVYLICSLEFPEAPVIRAFRINNEEIREIIITPDL